MNVSVIGLGKLGLPIALLYAKAGHTVHVHDVSDVAMRAVMEGLGLPDEPGLTELWQANRNHIKGKMTWERWTSENDKLCEAASKAEIIFIVVPTPSNEDGTFDSTLVLDALKGVADAIREADEYKLIVVVSTITPTASWREIIPAIEVRSGKKCSKDFGYCYSPELIALGDVIRGLADPDFCLIGESDRQAGDMLEAFYTAFFQAVAEPNEIVSVPVVRMNCVNAELAKLLVNCALTVKISYANDAARLCSQLTDADARVVLHAVGLDERIGPKFLKPGGPFSGPCLPRDVRCLAAVARWHGLESPMVAAVRKVNETWMDDMAALLKSCKPQQVTILGLAYKPGTPVTDASQGINVAKRFAGADITVVFHDPHIDCCVPDLGVEHVLRFHGATIAESLRHADAVLLATPHLEYKAIMEHPEWLHKEMLFVDAWGLTDCPAVRDACDYRVFGENA